MRIYPWFLGCLLLAGAFGADAVDPDLFSGMSARSIGPAGMSGRIAVVTGIPGDRNTIYVGAATGGLWKSTDGGLRFSPIFDDQPVASIGAVTVDPNNHDVVWVGTGEGNLRNSVSIGNGVYKSLDAGRNWDHLGLPESERIHRILVDPRDGDTAYFAVVGKLWGDSEERGVYRTRDGGKSFERVLYIDENVGCADLVMDPNNPDKLFAAMYEFRRWPWFYDSGGPGSGIHVSLDGGDSWKKLTPEDGLPEGELGRIGLAIAPGDPNVVYALIEAKKNALYRSDDGGVSWRQVGSGDNVGNRPFYYADIRVDPENPLRVYSLWSLVSVSDDGGKSFRILVPWSSLHPDHHAMWIDPTDADYIIEGNDGGIGISTDRGESWRFAANIPVAQYYHIGVDDDTPYNVYGGMQDNGSWRGPSSVWENGGIRNHHWEEVGFGDGFDTSPHPDDSTIGYSMSQEGFLYRWNLPTGERKVVRPNPPDLETELRFNWNAGFAQDPFDADTIYYGSQFLHRSTDRGDSWEILSDDLTSNNPEWQKQADSGGLTPDVTGAENFTTIIAIEPSRLQRGVLWIGTDDGRVHVTLDGGQSYQRVDDKARGVPADTWVPMIHASRHDKDVAFVVFDNHRRSDIKPYAYRVSDYGKKWQSVVTDDVRGYALALLQDDVDPDLLYLGTEFGLYLSHDAGKNWTKWTHGVPTVSVMDLAIQERYGDLVLGTHGRAAFVLDDLTPLREWNESIASTPLHFFTPRPAQQYTVKQTGASRFPGFTEFRGENLPRGAMLNFWMTGDELPHPDEDKERARKEAERANATAKSDDEESEEEEEGPGTKITVTISDSSGEEVVSFEREVTQGLNRIYWSFDSKGFDDIPNTDDNPFKEEDGGGGGPEVLPGEYNVTLEWGAHSATQTLTVLADPRENVSMADRQANWDFLQEVGRTNDLLAAATRRVHSIQNDLSAVAKKLDELDFAWKKENPDAEDDDNPRKEIRDALGELRKKLKAADKKLRLPADTKGYVADTDAENKLGRAWWFAESTKEKPTQTAIDALEYGKKVVRDGIAELNAVIEEDLTSFREMAATAGLLTILQDDPTLQQP